MASSSQFTAAERLASLKAAAVGGLGTTMTTIGLVVGYGLQAHGGWPSLGQPWGLAELALLVNLATAALSGALFAVTYRYAVRQDSNPQLKAGVVLAFTLVRGLAQVDAASAIAQRFWPFLAACGQSLAMFAVAALLLEIATRRGWLAPF